MPDKKPKVLVLATTFPAHSGDGTPSFVLDVCLGLRRDFEIVVVAPKMSGAIGWTTVDGLSVYRFGRSWPFSAALASGSILDNLRKSPPAVLQVPFFLASFLLSTLLIARQHRPDVVHAHWLIPAGFLSRLLFRGPRVVTSHGGDLYALSGFLGNWFKRQAITGASVTVVNSEMAHIAKSLGAQGDVPVIPSGPVPIRPSKRTKVPGQVVFVGRLVEKKGLEFLLRAVRDLPCELHVVGDGPLGPEMRVHAPSNVVFHGQKGKDFVMNLIASSEVMVIPSVVAKAGDQEGMPLTLMESTASGVAVIATNLPGINEVIIDGKNGLLVPPNDSGALREALKSLLTDSNQRALFARELAKQSHRFSVDTVVAQYKEVLMRGLDKSDGAE